MAAVLTLDADTYIRSASQTLTVLFGYLSPEEIIGKPLSLLLSPPSFFECFQRTRLRKDRQLPCTSCVVVGWRKNGAALSLRLAISELKVGEDIFFCCLVEKNKDKSSLLTIDGALQIIYCNKYAARMFGRDRSELIGNSFLTLCPNFPRNVEEIRFSHDNSYRPTITAHEKKLLRGIRGNHVDGTEVTLCVEVTERKNSSDSSSLSGANFVLCINPIDEKVPYLIVDKKGLIRRANSAVSKLIGYRRKSLIGCQLGKLMTQPFATMKDFCELFRYSQSTLGSPAAIRKGSPSPLASMRVVRIKHKNGPYVFVTLELNEFREAGETLFRIKLVPAASQKREIVPFNLKESRYVGHYVLQETLIDGLYGKVKTATHKLTQEKVVVKIIEREKLDLKRFREIDLMRDLEHPHIVKMLEVVETPERQYIVLDIIEGGELYKHLLEKGYLSEDEARKFWRQLVSAVDYMHSKHIAHRDLKLENLMLDSDGNLVVIDFGLGNFMTPGKLMRTFCGSVAYAAPEMFLCQSYVGCTADIWSMGVILYSLILGFLPFEDPRRVVQADYIPLNESLQIANEYSPPVPEVSEELVDLIGKIFQKDPSKRITMQEICEHPWTNKGYSEKLPCLSTHFLQQHEQAQLAKSQQAQQSQQQQQPQQQHAQHAQQQPQQKVKEEIVKMLKDFGFEGSFISKSLEANELNPITASYYLLDKRLRKRRSSI